MPAEGNTNSKTNNQRNDKNKTKKPAGDGESAAEAAAGMGIETYGYAADPSGVAGSAAGAGASGDPTKIDTGNEGPMSGNLRDKNKPSR